ncbi:PIG-L family deacetylase [Pseudonocardia halophobica]|uniref:PIG-L family deacetylase n=1 Tax=Pseudonocardia halophobica TaxID=29401 RepID=UPI003D91F999
MAGPCDPWLVAVAARGRFTGAPALPVPDVRRCVVATAHLHEELCAAGGLMATLAEAGCAVEALAVTDGDGGPERPGAHSRERAGDRRDRPSIARGYTALGLDPLRRYRLGLPAPLPAPRPAPDDGLDAGADVAAALADLVRPDPEGTLLVAPWEQDGHPDHDLVGTVAARVAREHRVRLLRYMLEPWRDDGTPSGIALLPRQAVRRFRLSGGVLQRKDRAVADLAAGRADTGAGCAEAELFLV